jgi:D-xylulose reductase
MAQRGLSSKTDRCLKYSILTMSSSASPTSASAAAMFVLFEPPSTSFDYPNRLIKKVHFWVHGGVINKVTPEKPLVMGHEASGTIHAVGPSVTHLQPGDRVAIEPGFPCRRCKQCKVGKYNLCDAMVFAASPPDAHGTLCRLFRIPADFAYRIPDSLSLEEAVLVEPLAVAVHAVRMADVRPGQRVLVQGAGTIGLLVAATARAFGVSDVVVADIKGDKLAFAKKYVECTTFTPDISATPQQEARRLKQEQPSYADYNDGPDVVLECTGAESSLQTGLLVLAPGGVLVQVGMGKAEHTLPLRDMFKREVVLKMAFRYGAGDYEAALEMIAGGRVRVKELISAKVPFERAAEAWEMTRRGKGIKNLIEGVKD